MSDGFSDSFRVRIALPWTALNNDEWEDEITRVIADPNSWKSWVYDEIKCECGSEKTYGKDATHSHWCPKYQEFK